MPEFFSAVVRKLNQACIYSHTRHTVPFDFNAEEGKLRVFTRKYVYLQFDWVFFPCKVNFCLDVMKSKSFSLSYTDCGEKGKEDR